MDQRDIILYTRRCSLRCWRTRRLLRRSGYDFVVVDTTGDAAALTELSKIARHEVVAPYVLVDRRPVGDLGAVRTLISSGNLERLVRGQL